MAHNEHNKRKGNSGFALIIFGAMMFFLAPYVQEDNPDLAIIALIAGFTHVFRVGAALAFCLPFSTLRVGVLAGGGLAEEEYREHGNRESGSISLVIRQEVGYGFRVTRVRKATIAGSSVEGSGGLLRGA